MIGTHKGFRMEPGAREATADAILVSRIVSQDGRGVQRRHSEREWPRLTPRAAEPRRGEPGGSVWPGGEHAPWPMALRVSVSSSGLDGWIPVPRACPSAGPGTVLVGRESQAQSLSGAVHSSLACQAV